MKTHFRFYFTIYPSKTKLFRLELSTQIFVILKVELIILLVCQYNDVLKVFFLDSSKKTNPIIIGVVMKRRILQKRVYRYLTVALQIFK